MNRCKAWFDDVYKITLENIPTNNLENIEVRGGERTLQVEDVKWKNEHTAALMIAYPLSLEEKWHVNVNGQVIPIYARNIVRTKWFDDHYAATDCELGAQYSKNKTVFTVWAPTATALSLFLGEQKLTMTRGEKGIWQAETNGDWHGVAYDYEITINGHVERVNDPYTKGLLLNSKRGVVLDLQRTNSAGVSQQQRPSVTQLQDAIIYELHVRDATISDDSGVKEKGKYAGLTEKNTMTKNGFSTGLSYLQQLGITHVQLLPVNDFARVDEQFSKDQYNWGYDPLYYQVPEGSYAKNAASPESRISECKEMIAAFHEHGISVILDVVYNHVFIMEESPFEKLVPGYYFRYHQDGTLSNGTGVGNDFASERKMARKFILDTIDYWLAEFRVDGFRFDLMGILDVVTMKQIRRRCDQEAHPILLLGEGWELPTALAPQQKASVYQSRQLEGIRFFNDLFRDTLKGNTFDLSDTGFVNGNGRFRERLPHLVTGSVLKEYGIPFTEQVTQVVNYVECHDNHTLWDRLLITNQSLQEKERKKIQQMATGLTLLSQGIPFLHAGQEWFRSKQGDGNSYLSGDSVNALRWEEREQEDVAVSFARALIQLRKEHRVFRLTSKEEIRNRVHFLQAPSPVFGYILFGVNVDIAVYANPASEPKNIELPSLGRWQWVISNCKHGEETPGETVLLQPYEFLVVKKQRWQ
ncbi:type I pullulanase [Bacillaceae bacterium Marseille-Q3522]|nr:type I pullulanase [Bacillaceae bacterium Marseille-Q3522]